jgi:hypothetical protein
MKKRKVITYIIGIIVFLLPILLYLTPPKDSDGGPMMSYNFFYFYPIFFLSIILSVIIIFRLKLFKHDLKSIILLLVSILPTIYLTTFIFINFKQIYDEPPYDLNIELPNNTVNLKVNDTLDVNIHGFTNKKSIDDEEIVLIKKINIVPHINKHYSFKDGGCFIGDSNNYEVYYKVNNDSLFLYSVGVDFSYYNKKRISLPILISKHDFQKDAIKEIENKGFKKFEWK